MKVGHSEEKLQNFGIFGQIAEPKMVVSDGGTGFTKAFKKVWPNAKHQRCMFHIFCQVKRYTTSRPNTLAGFELEYDERGHLYG